MSFYLELVNHGGCCCGIKTLHGFGWGKGSIDQMMPSKTKAAKLDNRDAHGGNVSSDTPFFTDEAPKESRLDRLKRYIDFMKRRRPCNLLEAVLAEPTSGDDYCNQYKRWGDILRGLGFVEVISHQNSNSGNVCHVFYLKIDEDYPGKDGGDDEDEDYDEDD